MIDGTHIDDGLRRALLLKRLREGRDRASGLEASVRHGLDAGPVCLAASQRQLWFLHRLDPDSVFYNEFLVLRMRGPLDVAALERSVDAIVARHGILRTTFAEIDGQPVQAVGDVVPQRLNVIELGEPDRFERERAALAVARQEIARRFDLAAGPLVVYTLLRSTPDDHLFIVCGHHIVADHWSVAIFLRELSEHYAHFTLGRPLTLSDRPAQYVEFAERQRGWLASPAYARHLAFWKEQLEGAVTDLHLPTDHPRLSVESFRGGVERFFLPPDLVDRIKRLGQQEGTTLFMTLLAAFETLLHRYTGQRDFLLGTVVGGRMHPAFESTIGLFLNTLVLRARMEGDATFRTTLASVRGHCLDVFAHQEMPFPRLIEELRPSRDLSRNALFQVMFVLQNAPVHDLEMPGLAVDQVTMDLEVAKFDLSLYMEEVNGGINSVWRYNSDLFEPATVARMRGSLVSLLEGLLSEPDRPIAMFPLLDAAEEARLAAWTATAAAVPGLPLLVPDSTPVGGTVTEPRTPIEELVASVLAELLGRDRIGIHDDFFDLGGHSLLATQATSRIREACRIELPIRTFFMAPTVAGLAAEIDRRLRAAPQLEAPPLVPCGRHAAPPLSFAQQRLWFVAQLLPDRSIYNLPAAVRLRGSLRADALEASLQTLSRRHETLRTRFEMGPDREPVQRIDPDAMPALVIEDISGLSEAARESEIMRRAQEEAAEPFDLARGPLVRTRLLRVDPQDHVLLVTLHHIVADGWSIGILIRELSAVYNAMVAGAPPDLPPLPVQYADYAVWQRAWLQGAVLEEHLRYWREQLADAAAVIELPTDRPRPSVQSYRGVHHAFLLSAGLTRQIKALGRQQHATLFMTLLAGFDVLLHCLSGQLDVVVGTDIANRSHPAAEGLIGFFVNQVVLRTNLSGDPSFSEVLARVRAVALGAYAHQDLPFDKLVEELKPDRTSSHAPLFQVKLVLQNAPDAPLDMAGLAWEQLSLPATNAKLDQLVTARETPDGLLIYWCGSEDLFDGSTIAKLGFCFELVLAQAVTQPSKRLSEFSAEFAALERQQRARQLEAIRRSRDAQYGQSRRHLARSLS